MPYKEGQPTLMGFLGIPVVTKVIKQRFFGGPYLRLYNFFEVLSYLYMTGAILGRARCKKLNILAKMLVVPGETESKITGFLQQQAKKRLDKFRSEVGKEPNRFDEFILFRELESTIGLSLADSFEAYAKGNKKLVKQILKASDEKFLVAEAEPYIKLYGMEGMGFGSSYPDLTEKMYRTAYENIDMDVWAEAKAVGLAISEKPDMLNLEEQEELVLQMVAAYTSEYYSELLAPLDLRI